MNHDKEKYQGISIANEILMTIRSTKKIKNEISLNEPIGKDREGNEITYDDIISQDEDEVIDKVDLNIRMKSLLKLMSDSLKDREREIIYMRYGLHDGKCWTQIEIANKLNISRSYVSRIEKKAIKKLSKAMKYDEK